MRILITVLLFSLNTYAVCPFESTTVNIEAKNADIKDLIAFILDQSGIKYDISSIQKNTKQVTMEVKEANSCDVYEFLMTEADFESVLKIQMK
jgi:hypothetical protein